MVRLTPFALNSVNHRFVILRSQCSSGDEESLTISAETPICTACGAHLPAPVPDGKVSGRCKCRGVSLATSAHSHHPEVASLRESDIEIVIY